MDKFQKQIKFLKTNKAEYFFDFPMSKEQWVEKLKIPKVIT
jgi:hypothetical protein